MIKLSSTDPHFYYDSKNYGWEQDAFNFNEGPDGYNFDGLDHIDFSTNHPFSNSDDLIFPFKIQLNRFRIDLNPSKDGNLINSFHEPKQEFERSCRVMPDWEISSRYQSSNTM